MPVPSPAEPTPDPRDLKTSDQPAATQTPLTPHVEPSLPLKIGHYRIRRRIASGGMGTVYEATQENPRRSVAVKVMRQGIVSHTAMRRFEFEAHLLARLDHRGIAQVFEAGTYDDGAGSVPFFAMEYIPNAKRITEYVYDKRLDMRGRIALFAQVCDAVQHGHQKGIIHRDLKPANVLVDAHGQVKVIDFGVARSTDSDLAVTTMQTDVGQLIGTLQYMSPEQCEADPRDLDPRSDVYALGVLLYEILCERLPYDLSGMPISAATKVIRQFQPPRPSVLSTSLRGDVETILIKAMEKDRERRYRSAADLGDDLRRYLDKEPIQARPASLVYQIRVFARRNRLVFVAVAAVMLTVGLGLVVSTVLYFRAESARAEAARERDAALVARGEAEAVTQFLNDTLASVDSQNARGPGVTVVEMLDDAAGKIDGAFPGRPLVEAALRRTIGNSYISLERFAAAEAQLRASLELRQRECPAESVEVAESERDLGTALQAQKRTGEAEALYRRALATQRKLLGKDHVGLAETLNGFGVCLLHANRPESAEPLLREALGIRRRALGPEHRLVAQTLDNLGGALQQRGQYNQAAALHQESLAILRKTLGSRHITLAFTLNLLGWCEWKSGALSEAEQHFREALSIVDELRESRRWLRAGVLSSLGEVLHEQGRFPEAETVKRDALQTHIELRGEDDPESARYRITLAKCLLDQQKLAEAEAQARGALALLRRSPKPEPIDVAETLLTLGMTLSGKGENSEAEPLLRESLGLQRAAGGPDAAKVALTLDALGAALNESGRAEESEPLLREAVELFTKAHGPDDWRTAVAHAHLGNGLFRMHRMDEAERELLGAYRVLSTARLPHDRYRARVAERLAVLYEARESIEPGKGYAQKSAEWRSQVKPGT